VSVKSVFWSKLAVNLTLSIPAIIINSAIFAYVFKFSIEQTLLIFIVPFAYAFFTALMGLAANLAFPNFSWSSEIVVIKQSAAVILSALVGIASVAIPLILMFTIDTLSPTFLTYGTLVFLMITSMILYHHIMGKGIKSFATF
jgi:ABC-2 type transport system permease protein